MKVRLRNTLAIAGLLSIMTLQTANAQDVSSYSELTAAIQSATGGDAINLTGDITAPDVGAAALGALGRTPVTIYGGGYTLDGNGANGLSISSGQGLTLTNFVEIKGFSNTDKGGAIKNAGNLSVAGKFSTNSAQYGGAIYNDTGATTTISANSVFEGNTATKHGGAIYNNTGATTTISADSVFKGNTVADDPEDSGYGGAIYNTAAEFVVADGVNVKFEGNRATLGGAIYGKGAGSITLGSGAKLSDNYSYSHGGAIHISNGQNLTIGREASFAGNSSNGSNDKPTRGDGGAIYSNNSKKTSNTVEIGDSAVFSGNNAFKNGGAVYNGNNTTLEIGQGATFTGNSASGHKVSSDTDSSDTKGGAIYNYGSSISIGDNARFESNTAAQGGAIFVASSDTALTLNKATFISNQATGNETTSAGGALAVGEGATEQVKITNSQFNQNKSDVAGGAIAQFDGSKATITVESTNFEGNSTGAEGGAIVSDSTLNIKSSTFTGNETKSTTVGSNYQDTAEGGGAIFLYDQGVADIQNTTFTGNQSGTFGGAIGTRSTSAETPTSSLTITGSTFTENTAGVKGGAISTYVGATITGSDFTENIATDMGGAIWTNKNTTIYSDADGVVFSGNLAAQGGAIYSNALLTLDSTDGNITFSSNTAAQGGASVYLNGTDSGLAVNGTAGTVSFQDNGAIAGDGNITKSNAGTIEFVGNTDVSKFLGKYTQEGGILNLSNSTMFNKYNIKLGEFNLTSSSSAVADGVNRVINDVAGVTVSLADGAGLDVTGGTLGLNNKLALNDGGILNVSDTGDVYFKGDSVWEGNVNNQNGGSVILDGYTHSTADGAGNYTQTGGDLTLKNSSVLTIGNADSEISGGTVDIQSGNTLNVGGGGSSQVLNPRRLPAH